MNRGSLTRLGMPLIPCGDSEIRHDSRDDSEEWLRACWARAENEGVRRRLREERGFLRLPLIMSRKEDGDHAE